MVIHTEGDRMSNSSAGLALAIGLIAAGCAPRPAAVNPDDPAITATIDSIIQTVVAGAEQVDADQVLSVAEGPGEFTFVSGDVMLSGLEPIRQQFRRSYSWLEKQDQNLLEHRVRVLSPDVAVWYGVSEGTYTDIGGETSEPVGMGTTVVFVKENGRWQARHAHQSIAK